VSVLRPIGNIGLNRSGGGGGLLVGLVLGLALGGGGGYLLGRHLVLQEQLEQARQAAEASTPQPLDAPVSPGAGPRGAGVQEALPAAPADQVHPAIPQDTRRVDVTITGSLYRTLVRELDGREADILNAQLGRVLAWWFDLRRDVLRKDRVEVLYHPVEGPAELRPLVIRYTSNKHGKVYTAYLFKPENGTYARYYDAEGREIERRLVPPPIEEYEQVTELMNLAGRRHNGVDFKCDVGTPVKAPFRSRVLRRNWNTRLNGNCLELRYIESNITALFLHLDEFLPGIEPGKVIEAGTEVARAGNSGRSTAPHLHYELHSVGGRLLNPFEIHKTTRLRLEGEDLETFKVHRKRLEQALSAEPGGGSAPAPSASSPSTARKG